MSEVPQLRYEDKIRIREAMNIAKLYGDQIWNGYSEVPFAVILVTDTLEFLINHPNPSDDFTITGKDDILGSEVGFRNRVFDKEIFASFPAVNGISCIVAGTPENTGKNSADWIITFLHEHFHKFQSSQPGYYDQANSLELSRGDNTGMWMISYPFPYDGTDVNRNYDIMKNALSAALGAFGTPEFELLFRNYSSAREIFLNALNNDDRKYYMFQIWQEGIARYTEYKFLEAISGYESTPEYSGLAGNVSFSEFKGAFFNTHKKFLEDFSLKENKRGCFYEIGFAEGILLDAADPGWRSRYFEPMFSIEFPAK